MVSPGTRVGPYEIRAPLGGGLLSDVYRAWDERANAEVALKILSPKLARDMDTALRFEREARAAAALSHPNIVRLYEVGRDGERLYAAMEFLGGVSLRNILQAGALDSAQAVRYALQIAEAVAFAHNRGILHRDLKPENVIVEADGSVKVLDFGIARAIEPASFDSMEVTAQHFHMRTGAVVGNIGYMAPEQLSGEPVDQRADIFSFGCILYEMVAHHQPFRGGSAPERMAAILTTSAAPLPPGAASPSLERTIQRCLAKEPDHRFATMNELLNELRADLPASIRNDRQARQHEFASAPPAAPAHRVWMVMAIALIAVGLAGAAFAVWLLLR